jgi:hypothetical protein
MGTVADKERDASESSGISDMMEIAASLGLEDDDEVASAGVTRADDDEADDDLDHVASGYGGAAAAALIADPSIEPEPAVAANAGRSASESKVARIEPPPPPPARTSTTRTPSGPTQTVAAASASTSSAKIARPVSASVPIVAPVAPKASASVVAPRASASVAAPIPVVATAQPPERKKGGAYLLIGAGLLALVAILWFAMDSINVKPHPSAASEVRTAAATTPEPPPEPPKKVVPVVVPPPVDEPVIEEVVEPPPPEEAKVEVNVSQKKKRGGKAASDDLGDKAMPTAEVEKQPTQGEIDEKFRTECLLNPSKAGCDEIRKRSRETGDLDAKLADKLTASQVREGFSKVKGKAKACGAQHGVEAGAIVRVKVSIGGAGDVISVDAMDSFAGTPLGDCVANALKDAHFPRFTSESQGTVYPVSF